MIRRNKICAGMLSVILTFGLVIIPTDVYGDSKTTKKDADKDADVTVVSMMQADVMTEMQKAEVIGKLCQKDYQESDILASVTAAQCILESGYLETELAFEANNCFGMKATLSGNSWEGSTWSGDIYTKQTNEEYDYQYVTITADFRKYDNIEQSLADHSAYLLGAKRDDGFRYQGLKGEQDYKQAIGIIVAGGYATDSKYADKLCSIIERYDLTRYDTKSAVKKSQKNAPVDTGLVYHDEFLRVRKEWNDEESQLGAYELLDYAKRACPAGYKVFDQKGNVMFEGE